MFTIIISIYAEKLNYLTYRIKLRGERKNNYRSIIEGLKSRFVNDDGTAEIGECEKQTLTLNELSDTLEQLDFQIRFLSGLVYRLAQESGIAENSSIRILRSVKEVADYMYKNEGDMVMLTSPEHMPMIFKSRDMGWLKDSHEFANWLMVNWRPESLVIAVS
jgi:hypothetical protein